VADLKTILAEKHLDRRNDELAVRLGSITTEQVQKLLHNTDSRYSLEKLLAFLSPAAASLLEEMAQLARKITIQRFGRTIQLYAPLYVSNYCVNSCTYCGYSKTNQTSPTRLTIEEALAEADILAARGFRHILLVSGSDVNYITTDYLCQLASRLRKTFRFSSISIEIYPMSQSDYSVLFAAGIDGVTAYQETYDRKLYAVFHPAGPKSDYDWRLATHDRAGSAGMRRLGIAALLGLSDWRAETLALAEHANYLIKNYWKAQVSFSFPRLRPACGSDLENVFDVTDRDMLQMIVALRLCFHDAGIVLSTRESAELRDRLIKICVTRVSAGSKTNPGGYSGQPSTRQFEIDDSRTPSEIAKVINAAGSEAVWKDWDSAFTKEE
jgi:2-iminoacetate synthase